MYDKVALPERIWVRQARVADQEPTAPPELSTRVDIGEFQVEVALLFQGLASRSDLTSHEWSIAEVRISVEGDDADTLPPVAITADGGRDFSLRAPWMTSRIAAFRVPALEAVNRFLHYGRYEKRWALIRPMEAIELRNPAWFADGERFDSGHSEGVLKLPLRSGIALELSSSALAVALAPCRLPSLDEELLMDATDAAASGDLRRGIVYAATACEVAANALVEAAAPTNEAIRVIQILAHRNIVRDRLEDVVAIIEVALSVKAPEADRALVRQLYQARHRVVHDGQAEYPKAGSVVWVPVSRDVLEKWISAAREFTMWLRELVPRGEE